MVGLSMKEKKRIWNQEYWAKHRGTGKTGGGSEAAKAAVAEYHHYNRALRPKHVIGYCPDPSWWKSNDENFKRGLLEASKKAGF